MPEEIALICTVEEVPEYANSVTRTFAMNISVGLVSGGAPQSDLTKALLQPWNWKMTGVAAYSFGDGSTGVSDGAVQTTLLSNSTVDANALSTLKTRIGQQFTETLGLSQPNALFTWNPASPGTTASDPVTGNGKQYHSWPDTLAHLSTYPAPAPQVLNLVLFFTVKTTDLTHTKKLVAAPLFTIDAPATVYAAMSGAPVPPPAPQGASSEIGPGSSWQYSAATVTVAAHQPDLTIAAMAAPSAPTATAARIEHDTVWLTPEYEDGNEDWRSTLELRLTESFDLGRQLLDSIAGTEASELFGAAPTYPQVEVLRQNILAVLRDTADFGLRCAPDGVNLLRYVITRLTLPGGTPPVDPALLENELIVRDAGVLVTGSLPGYKSWTDLLTSLGGVDPLALTPCPTAQAPMPDKEYGQRIRALRDLQRLLAKETTIASLVFSGWDNVFTAKSTTGGTGAPAPVMAQWNLIRSQLQATLNDLATKSGLRKRMLLANLGGADATLATWSALVFVKAGGADDITQVTANINTALQAYGNQRMGFIPRGTADFQTRTPVLGMNCSDTSLTLTPQAQTMLKQNFTTAAVAASKILTPDPTDPVAPSPKAHPAVLRVHTLEDTADTADPLRGIAGVGMLLRESSNGAPNSWTCLDAAKLNVIAADTSEQTLTPVTFAPYRLIARNGVLQAAISFENKPLAADSPVDALAGVFAGQSDLDADGGSPYTPLLRFRYISDATQPWSKMTALKYGRKYDALGFVVRSSGALPKAIAAAGPAAPVLPGLDTDVTANVPASLAATFTYNRRTPVGPLRVKISGNLASKPLNQSSLPPIPATVAPIAREIANPKPNDDGSTLPLLLLWESAGSKNTTSYTFELRPPAAELEVWDRWVLGRTDADKLRFTRAAVRIDSGMNRPKDLNDQTITDFPGDPAVDISLNDPAVSGLLFSLQPLYSPSSLLPGAPSLSPVYAKYSDLQALPNGDALAAMSGFNLTQNNRMTVTVTEVLPTAAQPIPYPTLSLNAAGNTIDVAIPAGEVFRFTIAPCIPPDTVAWFDAKATQNQFTAPPAQPGAQPEYIASATPLEFLIETARPAAITSQNVWDAVVSGIKVPDYTQPVLGLSLTASAGTDWYLVRRIEVARQVWRWMGRPLQLNANDAAFPTTAAGPAINQIVDGVPGADFANALNWEPPAFAEREDSPSVTQTNLFVTAGAIAGTKKTMFTQDFSKDLRAHYLRFGVTVFSRYEGLPGFQPFASTGISVEARAALPQESGNWPYTPWIRSFVPCRIPPSSALTKPKVLLCIPLTGRKSYTGNDLGKHSLLVIADETWTLQGGLAEQLIATIQGAVRTKPDGSLITTAEIGPDPIFYANGTEFVLPSSAPSIAGTPIGTTFDDVSNAPLLANTCFKFDLDDLMKPLPGAKPQSLDWMMVKLQFQRTLNPSMMADPAAAASASQLTDGTWIEFLPSSLVFTVSDGSSLSVNNINFTWSGTQLSLQRTDQLTDSGEPQPLTLIPGPRGNTSTPPNLQLWALLMRSITDAAAADGELYVGLVNLTKNTSTADPAAIVDHIYLIEVQSSPGADNQPHWIDDLFPNASNSSTTAASTAVDITGDVSHRVLRISEKIAAH